MTHQFTAKDAIRITTAVGRHIAGTDTNQLPDLQAIITHAELTMKHTVHDLRTNGYTWSEIGRDLGVTKQAAHSRFSKYLCPDHACRLCYWPTADTYKASA